MRRPTRAGEPDGRHRGLAGRSPRAWPVAVAACAVVVLLGAFVTGLRSAQSNTRHGIETRFGERARASAVLTHSLFASAVTSSRATQARMYGAPHVSDAALTAAAARTKSPNLLLLSADGEVIAASAGTPAAVRREAQTLPAYVRRVLAGEPFALSTVHNPGRRDSVIQYAQKIETPRGRRVLVSGFSPSMISAFLNNFLAGSVTTRSSRAYVLDESGAVIASAGRGMRPGSLEPGLLSALRHRSQGRFGQGRYFAASRVEGTPWKVIATNSQATIFASVSGASRWLPWILLAAFACASCIALALTARMLRHAARQRAADARFRAAFEQQVHLAALVESSVDAIVAKSLDGTITSWNSAAEKLYGYSVAEAVGQPIAMLAPPEHSHEVDRALARVREGKSEKLDTKRVTKDGRPIDVALSISPVADAAGEVTGACVIARDITARKRAQEELLLAHRQAVQASRAKSEFVANMSHEIRTPLNGVIGMSNLLRETPLDDTQRQYVDALASSGDALLAVISDVLDFSKIEAGRLELERKPFDLRRAVDQACQMLAPEADAKGLRLEWSVAEEAPGVVTGDQGRLRQVLLNLLSNAVKFTPSGEVVVSVTREPQGMLRFAVTDTGVGIEEAKAGRLFEAFMQADQSTTREYGGTGLGLAISSQLARLMDGAIGAKPREGGGSTFWFTARLPEAAPGESDAAEPGSDLAAATSAFTATEQTRETAAERDTTDVVTADGAHDPAAPTMIPTARGPLVLVVEDNEINRTLAQALLAKLGVQTLVARNGREAFEMAQAQQYAAIFMDCQMPELDGYQATRLIRARETGSRVPIIAMTAHSMSGDRERCLAAGMDDYVAKPVRTEDLAEVIRRWVPANGAPDGNGSSGGADAAAGAGPGPAGNGGEESPRIEAGEPPTGPQALEPELDEAMVQELCELLDPSARAELLADFEIQLDECIAAISTALSSGEENERRRVAHLLKGSSATLGARALSSICEELQLAEKVSDPEEAVRRLRAAGRRARSALREQLPA